ncbi:hypothetical protein MPC1_900009 [Methylocella tundrae]|nr:hypothetical protein MPC1_900009 [Methylocella tundrae]
MSSGVESAPGVKDMDKVADFVARARAAEIAALWEKRRGTAAAR